MFSARKVGVRLMRNVIRGFRVSGFILKKSQQVEVFDRALKQRQRTWALGLAGGDYYDYLRNESARQICERVEDITRNFPVAVDLGSHRDQLFAVLNSREGLGGTGGVGGVETLYQLDMSVSVPTMVIAGETETIIEKHDEDLVQRIRVAGDDERPLDVMGEHRADLVISSLNLHWANDLQGALAQARDVLKPDGCFIASLLGGSTLQELRYCLYLAEQERRGGVSPHASPLIQPSDMAALMQGAKFALPTIDIDTHTISYPDAFTLMEHLSRMGEGTAALNRQFHVGKDTFLAAASLYQELYGLEDGSVPATFQVIYAIGWAPHESQPSCLKRGSATVSMKDISSAVTHTKAKKG